MTKYRLTFFVTATVAVVLYLAVCHKAVRAVNYQVLSPPVKAQVVTAAGGAQSNAATLTGATGQYTYIEGFDVTGGGATAASIVEISTTGLSNNLKYEMNVLAGVTGPVNAQGGLFIRFPTPIPSSATNTNIVVTLPSLGAGNTNASITVYGFTAP
jgi:hypothetical protein